MIKAQTVHFTIDAGGQVVNRAVHRLSGWIRFLEAASSIVGKVHIVFLGETQIYSTR